MGIRSSVLKFRQMPGNAETRPSSAGVEIPQPRPGAAFEGGAVAAEARTLRRAGGDVGHGVEGGIDVFAEFLEVAVQTGFQIGVEFRLFVALPRFRVLRQPRPAGDLADQRSALTAIPDVLLISFQSSRSSASVTMSCWLQALSRLFRRSADASMRAWAIDFGSRTVTAIRSSGGFLDAVGWLVGFSFRAFGLPASRNAITSSRSLRASVMENRFDFVVKLPPSSIAEEILEQGENFGRGGFGLPVHSPHD